MEEATKLLGMLARHTSHTAATIEFLKEFQKEFVLTPQQIISGIETGQFFKPEGLVKIAKGIGMPSVEIEELEERFGLRKKKKHD